MNLTFLLCLIYSFYCSAFLHAVEPKNFELEYSHAVIDFHDQKFNESLTRLQKMVKVYPGELQSYELLALIFKAQNKTQKALKIYKLLIIKKEKLNADEKEIAPYYFELGSLYFKGKKYGEAKKYLEKSLQAEFNLGTSNLLLGLIAFEEFEKSNRSSDWSKAFNYFYNADQSIADEIKVTASLYLSQTYSKIENTRGMLESLQKALTYAQSMKNSPEASESKAKIADSIIESVEKSLAPLRKPTWFGNLSLLTGYDSNINTLPESASSTSTEGKSTFQESLSAGVGYMTSPLNTLQWIPSYKLGFNYNFNRKTASSEYLSHTLANYLTLYPLKKLSYGLKIEGVYTFQNAETVTSDTYKQRPLSFNTSFGPYVRYDITPKTPAELSVYYEPQNYFRESTISETIMRSGSQFTATFNIEHHFNLNFFNPSLNLSYLSADPKGVDYKNTTIKAALGNSIKLSDKLKLSPGLEYSTLSYSKRSDGKREDTTTAFVLSGIYSFNTKWTFLGNLRYTNNTSNIEDTYSYKRFQISAGASYPIF